MSKILKKSLLLIMTVSKLLQLLSLKYKGMTLEALVNEYDLPESIEIIIKNDFKDCTLIDIWLLLEIIGVDLYDFCLKLEDELAADFSLFKMDY